MIFLVVWLLCKVNWVDFVVNFVVVVVVVCTHFDWYMATGYNDWEIKYPFDYLCYRMISRYRARACEIVVQIA